MPSHCQTCNGNKEKNPENGNKKYYEHEKSSCKVVERETSSGKVAKKEHGKCTESSEWDSY